VLSARVISTAGLSLRSEPLVCLPLCACCYVVVGRWICEHAVLPWKKNPQVIHSQIPVPGHFPKQ
jgi:hypothetical protein